MPDLVVWVVPTPTHGRSMRRPYNSLRELFENLHGIPDELGAASTHQVLLPCPLEALGGADVTPQQVLAHGGPVERGESLDILPNQRVSVLLGLAILPPGCAMPQAKDHDGPGNSTTGLGHAPR